MAGRLMVSTDELRALGAQLSNSISNQMADLQRVAREADPAGIWDGDAADQYRTTFDSLKMSLHSAMEALKALGDFLPQAANAYDEANDAAKVALGL